MVGVAHQINKVHQKVILDTNFEKNGVRELSQEKEGTSGSEKQQSREGRKR